MTDADLKAIREAMEVCMCPTVAEGMAMLAEIERLRSEVASLRVDAEKWREGERRAKAVLDINPPNVLC